jgi:CPA2 family monovalent cation:H+ antiporter-2
VVGYLLAGVVVGPFTPGFVADVRLAPQLAEIGVILLMFGVGMHFSVRDLLAVKNIAVPGALAQIVVATALGTVVAMSWGWPLGAGLVFGLSLSVASTVVLLRALEAQKRLNSSEGRIAVGWLSVEDLVMVLALGVAFGSAALFGMSFALGAFFAGMVINESDLSHRAAADLEPLQNAFAVLFFVAVGMLFDPAILLHQPFQVLSVVVIIVLGKSLAALGIVLALRYPLNTALTVSASLAQIGEFSFILAGLGISLGLLPPQGQNLIVAGALLSITLNPLVFRLVTRFQTAPVVQAPHPVE